VILRRLVPLAFILALVASVALLPAAGASGDASGAGASKVKCPKGKKLVVVRKNGKVVRKNGKAVRKCVRKAPPPACRAASASCATPAPAPLFEAPGSKLEGNAAVPFLQKYLYNSTFTDCPAGWPNCSVEQRYSHTSSGYFYYCRLTSVSGADIINGAKAYQVKNAVVEPDGSWTFNEQVENSGGSAFYEWHVATNGVVNGAYQFNGGGFEQLGPLQYLGGVAKDCSY
jgi:hypothetical protein